MRTPMMLPWIARSNGLSQERAEALWEQAVTMADYHFGTAKNDSEYWTYAVDALLRLARCDGKALQHGVAVHDAASAAFVRALALQQLAAQISVNTVAGMWRIGAELWLRGARRNALHI